MAEENNDQTASQEKRPELSPRDQALDLLLRKSVITQAEANRLLDELPVDKIHALLTFDKHRESAQLVTRVVDEFFARTRPKPKDPPELPPEQTGRRKRKQ